MSDIISTHIKNISDLTLSSFNVKKGVLKTLSGCQSLCGVLLKAPLHQIVELIIPVVTVSHN